MDPMLFEKVPHQPNNSSRGNSIQDPMMSPRSRAVYNQAQNAQSRIVRLLSNIGPTKSSVTNLSSPKNTSFSRICNQANLTEKSICLTEENQPSVRNIKNQPRISKNLPAVFNNDVNTSAVKIKRIVSRQKKTNLTEVSIDNDGLASPLEAVEVFTLKNFPLSAKLSEKSAAKQQANPTRSHRSYLSPVRVLNSGRGDLPNYQASEPSFVRKPTMPVTFIKAEESSPANNIKRVIVFRKLLSKSPESRDVQNRSAEGVNRVLQFGKLRKEDSLDLGIRKAESLQSNVNGGNIRIVQQKTKICLNEMVTLKKIRTTTGNGIIKRMLHAPSMNIYDIQEEPIKTNDGLREWISAWKNQFHYRENNNLLKILTCFWNSPEGNVSVLLEATKNGSVQDILNTYATLPENCIQSVAKGVVLALRDIHQLLNKAHGSISATEVSLDENFTPKLCPSISHYASHKNEAFGIQLADKEKEKENERISVDKYLIHMRRMTSDCNPNCQSPQRGRIQSNGSMSQLNKEQNLALQMSTDIFDLGYMLLTCALGSLEFYDLTSFYSLENIKQVLELLPSAKKCSKTWCCLLHSEVDLRKFCSSLETTSRFKESNKKLVANNYGLNSQGIRDSHTVKKSYYHFTLLELLQSQNRFSESFIDFLCACLKIESTQRPTTNNLLTHEFFSESHKSQGTPITFSELISVNKKRVEYSPKLRARQITTDNHTQFDRVCEAIKIVLMNCDVRDKVNRIAVRKEYEKEGTRDHKKLLDLANELDISLDVVIERFRQEIFV